jgi:hypothetical protein
MVTLAAKLTSASLGANKMDEHLLTAFIVAPFIITMVGFAVAIAFAPAVPNDAPATEHDNEEWDPSRHRGMH